MNLTDLRKKTQDELTELLKQKKKEIEDGVQGIMKNKNKNTTKIKGIKKEIAQVTTVIREKEILSLMEEANA